MKTKMCSDCGLAVDVGNFYKRKASKGGLDRLCISCRKVANGKSYALNKEKILSKTLNRYHENRESILAYRKRQYHSKRTKIIADAYKYKKNRLTTDPLFRLVNALRARVRTAIKRNYKSGKTLDMLGCSVEFLRVHLESKFQPGMTWENYGLHGWHMDHIKPCSSFNLADPEQQRLCFHWSNLQPLWAEDNLKKADSF